MKSTVEQREEHVCCREGEVVQRSAATTFLQPLSFTCELQSEDQLSVHTGQLDDTVIRKRRVALSNGLFSLMSAMSTFYWMDGWMDGLSDVSQNNSVRFSKLSNYIKHGKTFVCFLAESENTAVQIYAFRSMLPR